MVNNGNNDPEFSENQGETWLIMAIMTQNSLKTRELYGILSINDGNIL